jgi:hypothetical protein
LNVQGTFENALNAPAPDQDFCFSLCEVAFYELKKCRGQPTPVSRMYDSAGASQAVRQFASDQDGRCNRFWKGNCKKPGQAWTTVKGAVTPPLGRRLTAAEDGGLPDFPGVRHLSEEELKVIGEDRPFVYDPPVEWESATNSANSLNDDWDDLDLPESLAESVDVAHKSTALAMRAVKNLAESAVRRLKGDEDGSRLRNENMKL